MTLFELVGKIVIDNQAAKSQLNETADTASDSSNKIVDAFRKIGAAVATYLTVDKIKDFGIACINAASDANAASSQFTQVFGDMEGQASTSLSNIANTAGMAENRMKGSFTKIASFAKVSGMDTESALALAERAMVAAADSAAFYDRSLEETTESLQSFLKGNFENDAALGLSCTETTRNAKANELYGKSFKDLSEAEKELTLLEMVEDANKASGALGQAARESDTWTNQLGNLKQVWNDFQAVLGNYILESAVDTVKNMAEAISDWTAKIPEAVEKIQELATWCSEHEVTMTLLGIAIGTVTTAIGFYTIAQNAFAIATAISTGVGTAFGAVMAFITSPITLVVLAIGALIAIGWLLCENWDLVKEKCAQLGQYLSEKWNTIKENTAAEWDAMKTRVSEKVEAIRSDISEKWNAIKENTANDWNEMKTRVSEKAEAIRNDVSEKWAAIKENTANDWNEMVSRVSEKAESIRNTISQRWNAIKENTANDWNELVSRTQEKFNSIKSSISLAVSNAETTVNTVFGNIKSKITDAISAALTLVQDKFNGIKQAISDRLNEAWGIVQDIIEKVKKAFDFSIKLDIKLPHVSVSGGEAPYGIGGKGSLPKFHVEWYRKAMDEAMILQDPTIFGYSNGRMLGGGEAGNEVVAGESHLLNLIGQVVESKTAAQNAKIIDLLTALLDAMVGGNEEMIAALMSDRTFSVGEREFGRLVRTYAR